LDLGGVAKGFALDLATEALRDAGVTSALLHGGSSTVVAIGSPPDAGAWCVALEGLSEASSPPPVARLRDRAMSVSSQQSDRPGHVIDPSTGVSAQAATWAACIGRSAEATDAWATALIVLGNRPTAMPRSLTSVLRHQQGTTLASGERINGWFAVGPDAECVTAGQTRQNDGEHG
ncbi:MAG: FAD:protein FMN transferase, partial [Phycisphaerales bacterium]|nr:FAD:protein FMN transferase [Phycisphaerales bacterium]